MTHLNEDSTLTSEGPIVAEVRAQRDAIAADVNYDVDELVSRLQSIEEEETGITCRGIAGSVSRPWRALASRSVAPSAR